MAKDIRSLSRRARLVYGFGCIIVGCLPIAMGLGYLPVDASESTAPSWVIVGAGSTFVIAGFMILFANHSRVNDLLAGFLLMLFGAIGLWVSVFSSGDGMSGGIPFVSRETNVLIGRWLFGLGALMSFALMIWAFRRAANGRK